MNNKFSVGDLVRVVRANTLKGFALLRLGEIGKVVHIANRANWPYHLKFTSVDVQEGSDTYCFNEKELELEFIL